MPGFSHWKSRHVTNLGDAEFDVCFHNDIRLSPFPFAEPAMVIECKNTGNPIGSAEVRNFVAKMEDVQLSWAVLVAANGITGSGQRDSHAHAVIQAARVRKVNVLVLTRAELAALQSHEVFADLIREKIMRHSLNAPFF
nr:restriction endonuclease [Caulobacter sp. FWC2]